MIKYIKTLTIVVIIFLNAISYAETVIVKDGDTIKLGSRNIRFYGIDAPESKQKCYCLNGTEWDCGIVAKSTLIELIAENEVNCITQSIDLYKREVAICYAGNIELNRLMVAKGMALAYRQYSKKYVADELLAKKQFVGIWATAFMEPEQWRRYKKFEAKRAKSEKP